MHVQLPLLPDVALGSSFEAILGAQRRDMSESTRRARWATWLRLARAQDRPATDVWRDCSGCYRDRRPCRHLRGRWCGDRGLPASVNPVTSYRWAVSGMACIGLGYEASG